MIDAHWRLALLVLVGCFATTAAAEIKGYDDDLSDATVAVVVDVDPVSGARTIPPEYAACPGGENPVNTAFGVGFTSGYAFVPASNGASLSGTTGDATLYGLEFEGADIYLYTVADEFCATGTRVGTQPVGHPNLESLTYSCLDGFLYSVAFDTDAHVGYLVRIDPQTGVGVRQSSVSMPRDVWIVGLVYNADTGGFLGVSNGFGARNFQEFYLITVDGTAIVIGPTGTAPQALQSLVKDGSGRLLAGGQMLYHVSSTMGLTPIGSEFPGTLWALAERDAICGPFITPTVPPTQLPSSTPTVPQSTPTPTNTRAPTATPTRVPPVVTTGGIGPMDTMIEVEDIRFLPPRGTMRIGDEVIRFDGLREVGAAVAGNGTPVPGILLNVQRGVDGTTAVAHAAGSQVIFLKPGCPGDCNNNDAVSISELVVGVNIALNRAPVDRCLEMDVNGNGSVSISELVGAVRAALEGC